MVELAKTFEQAILHHEVLSTDQDLTKKFDEDGLGRFLVEELEFTLTAP